MKATQVLVAVRSLACMVSVTAASSVAQEPVLLSPAQMEEDLFQMSEEFEVNHAGLLRYASREEIDEAFSDAMFESSRERTTLDFYRTIARLVSKIRCGHTSARPSQAIQTYAEAQRGLLPVEVHLTGDRLFVKRSLDHTLPEGAEVVSIDGRTIAEIRKTVFAHANGDGFIETGKERGLERQFARYYALYVQEADDDGPFEVALAGVDEPVSVSGMSSAIFRAASTVRPPRPVVELELRADDDLAVLRISTFGDPSGGSYPNDVRRAFERVREAGVGNLILDLRGNGGGNDNYGALLVSYFSPEPFGYFDHIEVTELYEGPGGIVERDGMRVVTEHQGTQIQQPSEPGFRGEAFLFTDGRTFSTAADVATVLHHNALATLVGEETGGGYDGNTSGITESHSMVHSGIGFRCPKWMYTTANVGHDYYGRGAIPHETTEPSIEDVLAGRDVELELVLARIAKD
jgi:hypothetical protein